MPTSLKVTLCLRNILQKLAVPLIKRNYIELQNRSPKYAKEFRRAIFLLFLSTRWHSMLCVWGRHCILVANGWFRKAIFIMHQIFDQVLVVFIGMASPI